MPECQHLETILCYRTNSANTKMYGYQCQTCGRFIAKDGKMWISKESIDNIESVPEYSLSIPQEWQLKQLQDRHDLFIERLPDVKEHEEQNNESYRLYLQSDAWKLKRSKIMGRCYGWCEGCGDRPAQHVHHLTYKHIGNEFLFELVGVCKDCHAELHKDKIHE